MTRLTPFTWLHDAFTALANSAVAPAPFLATEARVATVALDVTEVVTVGVIIDVIIRILIHQPGPNACSRVAAASAQFKKRLDADVLHAAVLAVVGGLLGDGTTRAAAAAPAISPTAPSLDTTLSQEVFNVVVKQAFGVTLEVVVEGAQEREARATKHPDPVTTESVNVKPMQVRVFIVKIRNIIMNISTAGFVNVSPTTASSRMAAAIPATIPSTIGTPVFLVALTALNALYWDPLSR